MEKLIQVIIANQDQGQNIEIEKALRDSGLKCNIKMAVNGGHALLHIQQLHLNGKIDGGLILVLLNINTPMVNGFEFLHQYKTTVDFKKRNIKIAVIDKDLSRKQKEKVENMGVSDFISLLSFPEDVTKIITSTIVSDQNTNNTAAIAA